METLADRIARDGPVNELDAVGWIIRLAKKLESLHSRGLAHGGVSPAAIKTGGVARTSVGMIAAVGALPPRVSFQSPERILQAGPSPSDDTWATAATLFNLITGKLPFAAPDEDGVRQKILASAATPLSMFDVGDDDLQQILDAAFMRAQSERASTMTALRQALEAWHPDSTARDLPALLDDRADEDDEDERTVMRPAVAMNALMAQAEKREDASRGHPLAETSRDVEGKGATLARSMLKGNPLLQTSRDVEGKTAKLAEAMRQGAISTGPASRPGNHGMLEDEDDETVMRMPHMIRPHVPSQPASARKPAGVGGQGGPVVPAARPVSSPASRPSGPLRPAVQGFSTATKATTSAPPSSKEVRAKEASTSRSFISRDALLDDGDEEATVMRAAPIELLRQTSHHDVVVEADRATPIHPLPGEMAASSGGYDIEDEPTVAGRLDELAKVSGPDRLTPPHNMRRPEQPTMLLPMEGLGAHDGGADPAARGGSAPHIETRTSEHSISRSFLSDVRGSDPRISDVRGSDPRISDARQSEGSPSGGRASTPDARASGSPLSSPFASGGPALQASEPNKGNGLLIGLVVAIFLLGAAGGAAYFLGLLHV